MTDSSSRHHVDTSPTSPASAGMRGDVASTVASAMSVEDLQRTMSKFNSMKAGPVSKKLDFGKADAKTRTPSGVQLGKLLVSHIDEDNAESETKNLLYDKDFMAAAKAKLQEIGMDKDMQTG